MSKPRTNRIISKALGPVAIVGMVWAAATAGAQVGIIDKGSIPPNAVLTYLNNNARTGLFAAESKLTPINVNVNKFGKLFSDAVDGYVYAQPLYVPNVTIAGKVHNVVYVATEHDSVYAFDADASGGALWQTKFAVNTATTTVTTVPYADVNSTDIMPEVGITATPVIDYYTNTIFVEAKTKEVTNGVTSYVHRLHALDITTGLEKPNSPVIITASVKGTGDGNDGNGNVPWNALRQHVRPALMISNGILYIASASHGDNGPYHGWVFGYEQVTLKQLYVINLTPNGGLGGVWQAGNGMAADALGNMYLATGNGTFTADPSLGNGIDYGDTYLKLSTTSGAFKVTDFFTPFNQAFLSAVDADQGSGGCLVVPTQLGKYPNILIGCGKEGRIYVINRDNMSHFHASGDTVLQSLPNAVGGTWSSPAFFNSTLYYNGVGDVLKAFKLSNSMLSNAPVSQSNIYLGFPGATPCISANGTKSGLVWILETDAYGSNGPTILRAFDATNLTKELYDSTQGANNRDKAGAAVKFAVPTITGGKVYVGTETELDVYGLL